MRRLLPAAAVLVPLAVLAAIGTAPPRTVVDLDNYNGQATKPTSYINAAQCAGTADLNLQWNIQRTSDLTGVGSYKIFASDTAPATEGDTANYCAEKPTTDPAVEAGPVGSPITYTSDIQGAKVSGQVARTAAGVDDCTIGDGTIVYICAHLYDGAVRRGYASGMFEVQVKAPVAPTGVVAGPASETSLHVTWTENTDIDVAYYVAVATPVGAPAGTPGIRSAHAPGTSATIGGLSEGTSYDVVVYAYSLGGNESPPSDPPYVASPAAVFDWWEWYQQDPGGGRDDGGCASGGGGPLALLAVGALLARLRRRR